MAIELVTLISVICANMVIVCSFAHQIYSVHIRKSSQNSIKVCNEYSNDQDTDADGVTHSILRRKNILEIENLREEDISWKKQLIAGGKAATLGKNIFENRNNQENFAHEEASPFNRSNNASIENIRAQEKNATSAINGFFTALIAEAATDNPYINEKQKEKATATTILHENPDAVVFTREQINELRKNCTNEVKRLTTSFKNVYIEDIKEHENVESEFIGGSDHHNDIV